MKCLSEELKKIEAMFDQEVKTTTVNFCLEYVQNKGWQFRVIRNWKGWFQNNYRHIFGYYPDPIDSVAEFLNYIEDNNINIKDLL